MKKLIIISMFIFASLLNGDDKVQPKKFEITFVVTYNELTLEEAGKKEAEIRKLFEDACKVDVKVAEVSNSGLNLTGFYNGDTDITLIDDYFTLPVTTTTELIESHPLETIIK